MSYTDAQTQPTERPEANPRVSLVAKRIVRLPQNIIKGDIYGISKLQIIVVVQSQ
jgi:hypothetical protein